MPNEEITTPEDEEPTQETVEETPVQGDEPSEEPTVSNFNLPYQPESRAGELEWYQQHYAQVAEELGQVRRVVEDYEMAGLTEQEREMETFRREREQWSNQVQNWQQQQAAESWRQYYAQFAEDENLVSQVQDPIQLGHNVLTDLHSKLAEARAEIEALQQAAEKPASGVPVTQGSQGGVKKRSLFDMSFEEREEYRRRNRMGLLDPNDIPTL